MQVNVPDSREGFASYRLYLLLARKSTVSTCHPSGRWYTMI